MADYGGCKIHIISKTGQLLQHIPFSDPTAIWIDKSNNIIVTGIDSGKEQAGERGEKEAGKMKEKQHFFCTKGNLDILGGIPGCNV